MKYRYLAEFEIDLALHRKNLTTVSKSPPDNNS